MTTTQAPEGNLFVSERGCPIRPIKEGDKLELGETGRGRSLHCLALRPGTTVTGRVRYTRVNEHLGMLAAAEGRPTLLILARTNPGYSRGVTGWVSVAGSCTIVATGRWAYGDAGRTGSGTDALVAVDGPSAIYVSGKRMLVADQHRVLGFSREGLTEALAADDDAWIRATITSALAELGGSASPFREILDAVLAAEAAQEIAVVPAETAPHYEVTTAGLASLGITVSSGVDLERGLALAGDFAVSGPETWAIIHVSPGGGKRWRVEGGVRTSAAVATGRSIEGRETVHLYRIQPGWIVEYDRYRDGEYHTTVRYSAEGREEFSDPPA